MGVEQRHAKRYPIAIAGEIGYGGETVSVSTENLSEGGVGLVLPVRLADGAKVAVTLFLTEDGIEADEEPFESMAQVRWTTRRDDGKQMAGVQFLDLSESKRAQLGRFLALVGS